jgi:hypothetical protein
MARQSTAPLVVGIENDFEILFCRRVDPFIFIATIDIAANLPKIQGNELRDIIYNQLVEFHRINQYEADPSDLVVQNLEGNLIISNQFDCLLSHKI